MTQTGDMIASEAKYTIARRDKEHASIALVTTKLPIIEVEADYTAIFTPMCTVVRAWGKGRRRKRNACMPLEGNELAYGPGGPTHA